MPGNQGFAFAAILKPVRVMARLDVDDRADWQLVQSDTLQALGCARRRRCRRVGKWDD
jgi:hypothetical protein